MTRLLLVRHGETDWNVQGRFQGALDIPLNKLGQAQAREVAALLADKPLTAVYSSHLQRALTTAKIIAEVHNLQVQVRPELQEINMGQWEGLTRDEVIARHPREWQQWRENAYDAPGPVGGETYSGFQARCIAALDAIALHHEPEDLVAVVTHGGVLKAVISGLLGVPWQSRGLMYFLNCSVTRLRWQPQGRVIIDAFNDACHLSDVQTARKK